MTLVIQASLILIMSVAHSNKGGCSACFHFTKFMENDDKGESLEERKLFWQNVFVTCVTRD